MDLLRALQPKKKIWSPCIIGINDTESELSDDCNNDSKFLWSDDEEIDAIIGDHTSSFVENPAPSPIEVSCVSTWQVEKGSDKLGYRVSQLEIGSL